MIVGNTTCNVSEMRNAEKKVSREEKGKEQEKLNGEKYNMVLGFIQNSGVVEV